jgi:gamma-glutamylcyclotransferase (GGCT)/AIG2-like uncharacterized protein YtfP
MDGRQSPADVFVYGTLTSPERVGQLVDSFTFLGPAVLHGLHAVTGIYPTLAPGGEVGGRVLRTTEIQALDAYEGVDEGLYVRIDVPAVGAHFDDTVTTYVGDPDALDASVSWPGDGPFSERVSRYVREQDVHVQSQ